MYVADFYNHRIQKLRSTKLEERSRGGGGQVGRIGWRSRRPACRQQTDSWPAKPRPAFTADVRHAGS